MREAQVEQAMLAANAAQSVVTDLGGPLGVVGRVVGLGMDELDAGVPKWAWLGVGLVVGAGLAYTFRDRIEKIVGE